MQDETQTTPKNTPKRKRRFFVWIGRTLLAIFLLGVFLIGMIHLPPVQKWGINKITSSMSKSLDTRVTLEGFSLNPISDLTLKDLYIGSPDTPGDTLLYAHRFNVDYKRLWDLFEGSFTINQVSITGGVLNIHRLPNASLTNLDLALLRMLPPKRDTTKAGFVLDLKKVKASSLQVNINDEYTGALVQMHFAGADILMDTFDITNNFISIRDLDMDEPVIRVTNRPLTRDSVIVSTTPAKLWHFDVGHLEINNASFYSNNLTRLPVTFPNGIGIDYSHLSVPDIDIKLDSMHIRGWDFTGKDILIHATHADGFEIRKLAASYAAVNDQGIKVNDLQLITPKSAINNSIELVFDGFTDFQTFTDSVEILVPKADMIVYVNDLLSLAPGLQKIDFFSVNGDKNLTLQGDVHGTVNTLMVDNINASVGRIRIVGALNSKDLAVPGQQVIEMNLRNSNFSASSLQEIFPRMKLPEELDRVGEVNFAGEFEGNPNDFHAFGTFVTKLGRITLDMNLNTLEGVAQGMYSGIVRMEDFDLGKLINNPDLGRVTLSGRVIDGKGLNTKSMIADVTSELTSLQFKGYTYRNARIDGYLTGKQFSGTMDINDPNVDMHFEGEVDFRDSLIRLDCIARIDSIDFWELGLSKKRISVNGFFEVEAAGAKLDAIDGRIHAEDFDLLVMDEKFSLDTVSIFASKDSLSNDRVYTIDSDVITGLVKGDFNPATLAGQLHQYLYSQYPSAISQPDKIDTVSYDQRLAWNLRVHNSQNWFNLAGMKGLVIENTVTSGTMDLGIFETQGTLDLPELHYEGYNVYGSTLSFQEKNGISDIDLEVIAADIKEDFFFEDVLVSGALTNDSVRLRFKTDHLADIIDEIDVDFAAKPQKGLWSITMTPYKLRMINDEWQIPAGNLIEIRKGYFNLENFELVSANQRIKVEDINNKGLEAAIEGFDISYLNTLWINDKFQFSGTYGLDLEIDNLYDIQNFKCVMTIPALRVNNVPYGSWELNANMNDPRDSVQIDLKMENNETRLIATGAFLPPIKSIPKNQQNYLRLALSTTDFPLDFLEFLLGSNIRDTEGSVDMDMTLKGKSNALVPNGIGKVYNGSTTIDYLGAAYSFHNQSFRITENMIDLSGTVLYDVLGNTARVEGGLTHRYLRNLGLAATIRSDRIMGLDVNSEQNNVFYGRGIGTGLVARFTGTVANPYMDITATTAKGTHIFIPLTGGADGVDKDFVVFLENGLLPANKSTPINLGGINLTMNLTITEDAIVEIIFDENTEDILRGIGNGEIQMTMTSTGEFGMTGDYTIEEGEYLFTSFRVVRKSFELLRGGTISWDGDPYNANLRVRAIYKGLSAPVYPLIEEYLANASNEVKDEARERTDILLTMTLTGSLLSPDIAFDIAFPSLTGEIKGYTDSKISAMRATENAMLEQVMGLLFMRSFLPSSSVSTGVLSKGIDNTLSELFSATLSSYLGGLLGNLIPQGQFLSGIDFQVGLDIPLTSGGLGNQSSNPEDLNTAKVDVELPLEFFNDRLSVNVGGNYVTGAALANQSEYFAGDVTFEYRLSADNRLKIRAYNRNTVTVEGRKNKIGVGVAYRREYDHFSDIFRKKKKTESDTIPVPKDR